MGNEADEKPTSINIETAGMNVRPGGFFYYLDSVKHRC